MAKSKLTPQMLITVEAMARHGDTDKAIYARLKISYQTFYRWLKEEGEFSEAYKRGKASTDDYINLVCESALQRLVDGYDYEETKTEYTANPHDHSKPIKQKQVVTKKRMPPNLGAIIWWLKNRDPERWKERQNENPEEEIPTTGIKFEVRTDD